MKHPTALLIAAMAASAPALAANAAAAVELRGVYANVEVIPEDRADISGRCARVGREAGRAPGNPLRRQRPGRRRPEGHEQLRRHSPRTRRQHPRPWLDVGRLSPEHHRPHAARCPRHRQRRGDLGNVRAAQAVALSTNGCSQWRIGDVSGALAIDQAGASNITAGSAGKAVLDLSGLTRIDMTSVRELNVDMSGMGKVRLKSISGAVDANLSGMGSVNIDVRPRRTGQGRRQRHGPFHPARIGHRTGRRRFRRRRRARRSGRRRDQEKRQRHRPRERRGLKR